MNYKGVHDFMLNKLSAELSGALHYHGVHHTLDVLFVTEQLCKLESVGKRDTILLKTAALFHDAGFLIDRNEHEKHSCGIARQFLPSFEYVESDIERICGMIMATRIPQSPQNKLEEILCDADLDYLGRPDFYSIGQTLFLELQEGSLLTSVEAWNRLQLNFLEKHHFFTKTNQKRREEAKQIHLQKIRAIVAAY